jgi:hypothetical protein
MALRLTIQGSSNHLLTSDSAEERELEREADKILIFSSCPSVFEYFTKSKMKKTLNKKVSS